MKDSTMKQLAEMDQKTNEITAEIRDFHFQTGQIRAQIVMRKNLIGDIEMDREQLVYQSTLEELEGQRLEKVEVQEEVSDVQEPKNQKGSKEEVLHIAAERCKEDEGFKADIYVLNGVKHVGYGRNIDANPLPFGISTPLTPEVAEELMLQDLSDAYDGVDKDYRYFSDLDMVRQSVLVEMAFNMGLGGLSKFRNMHAAFSSGDFLTAKEQMQNSSWYKQLPVRATKLMNLVYKDLEL